LRRKTPPSTIAKTHILLLFVKLAVFAASGRPGLQVRGSISILEQPSSRYETSFILFATRFCDTYPFDFPRHGKPLQKPFFLHHQLSFLIVKVLMSQSENKYASFSSL